MTLDDLLMEFHTAARTKSTDIDLISDQVAFAEDIIDRAGVVAVVRALRDELICASTIKQIEMRFEKILNPPDAKPDLTRPANVLTKPQNVDTTEAGQRLINAAKEASAIARGEKEPARITPGDVCEWVLQRQFGPAYRTCNGNRSIFAERPDDGSCPWCGKTIKFMAGGPTGNDGQTERSSPYTPAAPIPLVQQLRLDLKALPEGQQFLTLDQIAPLMSEAADEIERLTKARDNIMQTYCETNDNLGVMTHRAEAAEAEVVRLRDALKMFQGFMPGPGRTFIDEAIENAQRVLRETRP